MYLVCETGHTADISQGLLSSEVPDPSDGAHPGIHPAPVAIPPVLAGSQIEVPAHVVRLLVREPLTIHHVAGLEIRRVEAIHEVGAIIHELHHSATHVRTFIKPHSEGTTMLMGKKTESVTALFLLIQNKNITISVGLTIGIIRQDWMQSFILIIRM